MTAPFIAEAERAAYEAIAATWHDPDDGMLGLAQEQAAVAVAAVVPILAEHFAQAVEALRNGTSRSAFTNDEGMTEGYHEYLDGLTDAARIIREAATPTEGGTT
jgi:hypothetical protein